MTDIPLLGAEMCTALRDARTVFYCPCLGIRIARTGGSMLPVLCCLYCTVLCCTVLAGIRCAVWHPLSVWSEHSPVASAAGWVPAHRSVG